MARRNDAKRVLLARAALEKPDQEWQQICVSLGFDRSYACRFIFETGETEEAVRRFFKTYGAELATDDRIESIVEGVRTYMQAKGNWRTPRIVAESPILALPAHECQFVIDIESKKPYCGKRFIILKNRDPGTRPQLYCDDHDPIARRQEEVRFIMSRRLSR